MDMVYCRSIEREWRFVLRNVGGLLRIVGLSDFLKIEVGVRRDTASHTSKTRIAAFA